MIDTHGIKSPKCYMSLANKLTFFRIILTPVFFIFYQLPNWFSAWFINGSAWTVPVIIFIYIVSEVTDLLDGIAARKCKETSDFGKLFDPFADTLMQLTCFLCFVLDGIFPAYLFLIIIYREFGVLFIRNLMLKKGIAMGAKLSGKIKTIMYITAGGFALAVMGIQRTGIFEFMYQYFYITANVIFIISVIISILSFIEYIFTYRKADEDARH